MTPSQLFKILGPADYHLEETHSKIFAYLLDPSSELGISLLQKFVNRLMHSNDHDLIYENAKVAREVVITNRQGRINILVTIPSYNYSPLYLIIENKLNSDEHGDQLRIYHNKYSSKRSAFVFMSSTGYTSTHPAYQPFSYNEFASLIAEILEEDNLSIQPEARCLLHQYTKFISGLTDANLSLIKRMRQNITSYLKDLIHQTQEVDLDPSESYQDTWVGMMPNLWSENNNLMRIKNERKTWGLAFNIFDDTGMNIEFYWNSDDQIIKPQQIYDYLNGSISLDLLHPPYRVGRGKIRWESVYSRRIFNSNELQAILGQEYLDNASKEHIAKQFDAFRHDVNVMTTVLMHCPILRG